MARGLNKAMLIGHLGVDPELKYTSNGTPVTKFRIATTESWKDAEGKQVDRTEWHNIVIWSKLGEIAAQYLKKGSKVYLEGRISTRSYEDKDGNKKYFTEVVAQDMVMLDRKETGASGGESDAAIPVPSSDADVKPEEDLPF